MNNIYISGVEFSSQQLATR